MEIFEGAKRKKLYFYLLCFFVGKFLRLWKWDGCESSLLKRRGKDCCIYYRVDKSMRACSVFAGEVFEGKGRERRVRGVDGV